MNEEMTQILLGGSLGKIFGKRHLRAVKTTKEAIKALCCTINDFERYLNSSKARGITYAVFRGKENIGEDDLGYPVTGEVIRIVPRSEEHTSELQSLRHLVCRLLLE